MVWVFGAVSVVKAHYLSNSGLSDFRIFRLTACVSVLGVVFL